jgi:hypothetical protein
VHALQQDYYVQGRGGRTCIEAYYLGIAYMPFLPYTHFCIPLFHVYPDKVHALQQNYYRAVVDGHRGDYLGVAYDANILHQLVGIASALVTFICVLFCAAP